jgi:uncharacterized protein involved in exopolysaccharide biosynthesis
MSDTFDPVDFALYLRQRWRVAAICCGTALILAGAAGAMLPKRYTATSTLIIQPPAGSDPRASLAVSPVYLESLKTYENFASSDTLFARAIGETGIRQEYPNVGAEALKRRVLSVTKPSATRIIEIQATLGDPQRAQHLARFIAEQTVALNESLDRHADEDAVRQAENNLTAAETRLRDAEKAAMTGTSGSVDALTNDLNNTSDLNYEVQRSLSQARSDLAESLSHDSHDTPQIAAARAKIRDLDDQQKALAAKAVEQATALERSKPAQDALDAEQKLARADLETARTRLAEVRASSGARGERLEVLDPGIVPERPSYPNIPLMMLVAFTVSLMGSAAYLAVSFGYSQAISKRAMSSRAERVYNMR